MVFAAFENGIEVDQIHPQLLQIRKLTANPIKIPTKKIVALKIRSVLGEKRSLRPMLMIDPRPLRFARRRHFALAEPIGKDLIPDAAGNSFGRFEIRLINGQPPFRQPIPHLGMDPIGGADKMEIPISIFRFKTIKAKPRLLQKDLTAEFPRLIGGKQQPSLLGAIFIAKDDMNLPKIPLPLQNHPQEKSFPGRNRTKGTLIFGFSAVEFYH
jgi:hypothetical protein